MKLKLSFLLIIALLAGCANKSSVAGQGEYYRQEIEKSKRLAAQKEAQDNKQIVTVEPSYLTKEQRLHFSELLEIPYEEIKNEKLYASINEWMDTPYLWGGTTKSGVDCSAYVRDIYQKVYSFELPRTSIEQFNLDLKAHFSGQKFLQQGDLLFFRLKDEDKVVSHVGIYLQNGKFTGSNSPTGVQIADLNSKYWQDRFVSGARLLKNL
ncbi:C40 family peptidase [Zobellia sp. 1_MG-2023]|uniref:C40 family peptidase n=1 Tax=Zobellia sp. 1_MG-2023 TaxID=3062626 RepID=UPI0025950364|nr:C40 family peptidase [Zobellia sp. 1_MG-2023]MDO6819002.1 C40 family peptidase [Zobellia sp. 1_MG-2023]